MRGVAGARGRQSGCRTGFVDAHVQQLAVGRFLVGQEEVTVDRNVVLAVRVVDLLRGEEGVHAEGAGFVRNDRHDALAELLVAHEVLEDADKRHGRGDFLLAGAAHARFEDLVVGQFDVDVLRAAFGCEAAEFTTAVEEVLDLRCVLTGMVVRREFRVLFELLVGDRDGEVVASGLEVFERHRLHLVGRVAGLEVRSERVALDSLDEDDGRLAGVLKRCLVRRVHLAVVVAAALEVPDLLVGVVLDHGLRAGVATEEVVADKSTGLALVGLVVAVRGGVHQIDQGAVAVLGQQRVPLAAPDDLDDVPTGTSEPGFEFLDDLAVAADRAVKALQVAVDDEGQVVELFVGGVLEHAACFGLVHFAVAEESPGVLLAGVLDAAVVQVAVELRLRNGGLGADAHGDRGVLPEVRHLPRVRVGGQTEGLAVDVVG